MGSLFSNSWFISIAGGLVVTLLWEAIRFIRDKNAYNRRLSVVHKDFSLIIKSIIGEETLPELHILDNLLKGITQKHDVKYKDVSDVEPVFYSLTQEVMESSFLDYQIKLNFCEKLNKINESYALYIKERESLEIKNEPKDTPYYLRVLPTLAFLVLNIATLLMVTLLLDKESDLSKIMFIDPTVDNSGYIIIMLSVYIMLLGTYLLIRIRNNKRIRERRQQEELYEMLRKM